MADKLPARLDCLIETRQNNAENKPNRIEVEKMAGTGILPEDQKKGTRNAWPQALSRAKTVT